MSERERLIEIIRKAEADCANMKQCEACEHCGKGDQCQEELIADYLLANGVIVPPCKVGDTVYYLTTVDTVNKIFCGTAQGFSFDGKTIWISASYTNGLFYYHRSNEIGETVFLSRELAEKALAERSKE